VVNCKTNSVAVPGTVLSGEGTVSLYNECVAFDSQQSTGPSLGDFSLLAPNTHCSDEPTTLLAQAPFDWSIDIPSNPLPQGGGRGGP
jgi:hypothetical protein